MPALSVKAAGSPDAGALLQQVMPVPTWFAVNEGAGLHIQQPDGSKLPASVPFIVQRIEISGHTLLSIKTLHALVADAEGKKLNLSELGQLAQRLTDYYREQGYPLSRAIIPVQTVVAGMVRMVIIEGRYGEVSLNNSSRVKSSVLRSLLAPLQTGNIIRQRDLDRSLLLLSDINGVEVDATLKPGALIGSADMEVSTLPLPALTGSLVADNFGNRYTGQNRLNLALNYSNPLQMADSLNMNVMSTGSGMVYGRLAYEILVNGQGSRAGMSYSNLSYALGDTLAALQAHGTAQNQTLWLRHPFLRSRNNNINGQLQYDALVLQDQIDSSSLQTRRQLHNLSATLSGDIHDALLAGGLNTWSLGLTAGQVRFGDSAAQQSDTASAKTAGGFSKWNASLTRLQNMSSDDSLFLSLSGQAARANLDSSQKITVGGPYNVRAYAMGAASGDSAALLSAELRHQMGWFAQGRLTATAFFDSAYILMNANPWVAGTNHARLSGAGLGLNWAHPQLWNLRSFVAMPLWPLETDKALSARIWLTLSKGF
jgi:hemolysin activation/secretion protein